MTSCHALMATAAAPRPATEPLAAGPAGTPRSPVRTGPSRLDNLRTHEDRTMPVYYYDPPDRFVAGAVGQPGERIFYLQGTCSGRVTSVVLEDFRVGAIALAWDGDGDMVVIEAQEESDEPVEPLAEELPADGPGVLRVRITPGAARAFAQRAAKIVSAGRPPCPLCGLPLDTEGHICPRQNGHRASHA